jgi:5-methylthioadenosine/S-adenosylhomocysteine deaminase
MIRSGTTCFNDQQMHIHQTHAQSAKVVCGRPLAVVLWRHYDRSDHRLAEAFEEMDEIRDCDRLTYRLNPMLHTPVDPTTCTSLLMLPVSAGAASIST